MLRRSEPRRRRPPRLYTPLVLLCVSFLQPLRAQQLPLVHYGIRDGLPSSYVSALALGGDGLIWMASSAGLVRYDGVEFCVWRQKDGLLAESPDDVAVDGDGRVWMIYVGTGIQYMDRHGTLLTLPDTPLIHGDRIPLIRRRDDGSILALGKMGYYAVSHEGLSGPFHPLPEGGPIDAIVDLPGRGLLIATTEGAFLDSCGQVRRIPLPYDLMGGFEIDVLAIRDGTVWCYGHHGWVASWDGFSSRAFRLPFPVGRDPPLSITMELDAAGALWIASYQGLYRVHEGCAEVFTEAEGLSSSWISDLLIDSDGVLWCATEAGLDKLSHPAFVNYTSRADLPVNAVWAMEELRDGSVWLGTNNGIVAIDTAGAPRVLTARDGLPEESIVDLKAGDDGVWVLGFNGVCRWSEGRFRPYPYAPFRRILLRSILPVHASEVWIATSGGLFCLDPRSGQFTEHRFHRQVSIQEIRRVVPRSAGGWWVLGSRLWIWRENGSAEEVSLPEWVGDSRVSSIHDQDGHVFLVTSQGIAVRDGEGWTRLQVGDLIPFDAVRARDGTYWIGCSAGIAMHDGVKARSFGYYDGVAVEECNGNAALLARDGRVWLAGKNVTVVNPGWIVTPSPPRPLIVEGRADDAVEAFPTVFHCRSRDHSVHFRLACPSFFNEQEIGFRYRLQGFDTAWNPLERGAPVRYTRLPPGHYELNVQARQKHGEWDGPELVLPVEVAPAWWQTALARAGFGFGLVGVGFAAAFWRVRHLEAQRRRLRRLVAEQTVEITRQRDHLAELARVDELTGLPNRRTLNERVEMELVRAERYGRPVSLMIFDLDHFKTINDSAGHATGDAALRATASRGRSVIRDTDVLSRWGGDEFALLMPETDQATAVSICARLKSAVEVRSSTDAVPAFTISGGVATVTSFDDPVTAVDLLERADAALYRAKERGRNAIMHEMDRHPEGS
ncbi:diguanylate cyclase [Candidatus Fermentibacteria bacterium]|nr:diguanylate cyclase [Candidatus Fermentibacteria bacterium]